MIETPATEIETADIHQELKNLLDYIDQPEAWSL